MWVSRIPASRRTKRTVTVKFSLFRSKLVLQGLYTGKGVKIHPDNSMVVVALESVEYTVRM